MKIVANLMVLIGCSLFFSCKVNKQEALLEKAKKEMMQTERDFALCCKKSGMETAFSTYAAENAVIHRDNKLFKGKTEIQLFYKSRSKKGISLDWTPEFVDVSASADLGYTFGQYVYSSVDSLGNNHESRGIFHTVWKKQKNGTWRFVWD